MNATAIVFLFIAAFACGGSFRLIVLDPKRRGQQPATAIDMGFLLLGLGIGLGIATVALA